MFFGIGEDDRSNFWKMNVFERESYAAVPASKETQENHDQVPVVVEPTTASISMGLQPIQYQETEVAESHIDSVIAPWQPPLQPQLPGHPGAVAIVPPTKTS